MKGDMYLTKTDFVHYLQCPKSLWLLKHKPKEYPHKEFSDFLKKITREGYEVEEYAEQLFPDGVKVPTVGDRAVEKTREAIAAGTPVVFQATFHTDSGIFVRGDILERNADGSYSLFEVKSSTNIKKDAKHNHIKDACFQKIALEQSGLVVRDVYIIHINKEYVRGEEVDPNELLKTVSVTEAVRTIEEETKTEIHNALALLALDTIDESGCGCFRKTRSNHCDSFTYFNGAIPNGSVWEIGNIREKKLNILLERGVRTLAEVPEDIELSDAQFRQVRCAIEKRAIINTERIAEMLGSLSFPLYFFDYETAMNAVPRVPGMRPWQQIPFQFSLHILEEGGALSHRECISDSLFGTGEVIKELVDAIPLSTRSVQDGSAGTVVSWHMAFEKSRNKEMAEMYPQYRDSLECINERMFDLEDVFKEAYTDVQFCGSTSIKKVLPIVCPHLSYKDLAVQDGTQAMEQWFAMIEESDEQSRKTIRDNLLKYCELDTFAMVEIYNMLLRVCAEDSAVS